MQVSRKMPVGFSFEAIAFSHYHAPSINLGRSILAILPFIYLSIPSPVAQNEEGERKEGEGKNALV